MYQTEELNKMVARYKDIAKRIDENEKEIMRMAIRPLIRGDIMSKINNDIFNDLDKLSNLIPDHDNEEAVKLIKRIKMMVLLKDII